MDRFSQFLWYLYVKMGPVSEQEICALNGYPRVQNVFSFDSQFDSPQKVKRKPCSLLNASYNVIAKQYIFVLWMKAFPHFWLKQRSQIRPKWKQNKTKITTKLADLFGSSMVHEYILLSCDTSFDPLLTKPSSRSRLKKVVREIGRCTAVLSSLLFSNAHVYMRY